MRSKHTKHGAYYRPLSAFVQLPDSRMLQNKANIYLTGDNTSTFPIIKPGWNGVFARNHLQEIVQSRIERPLQQ